MFEDTATLTSTPAPSFVPIGVDTIPPTVVVVATIAPTTAAPTTAAPTTEVEGA